MEREGEGEGRERKREIHGWFSVYSCIGLRLGFPNEQAETSDEASVD